VPDCNLLPEELFTFYMYWAGGSQKEPYTWNTRCFVS